jgi:FKBP-type peptidyl-prolyl cis-trans isomerase
MADGGGAERVICWGLPGGFGVRRNGKGKKIGGKKISESDVWNVFLALLLGRTRWMHSAFDILEVAASFWVPNQPRTQNSMSDIALAKGEKFLEDNAKKEGVTVTASGLQYKVITPGTGKSPKATDTVEVHYEGTLIDGKVFDSSYQRKESIEFPLNRVIAGWTEGVQLMQEGSKYRFYIPSKLAYGPRGAGRDIGPNEALIFDVELIKVK